MGEVENIGPSTKRNLIVDLVPGDYQVACKPGMVGNGIRSALKVTGTHRRPRPLGQPARRQRSATTGATSRPRPLPWSTTTEPFVAAIKAGDIEKAKVLYAAPRTHYERIEPIAESFGDLDPLIDERIDDVTKGQHRSSGSTGSSRTSARRTTSARTARSPTSCWPTPRRSPAKIPTVKITPLIMANGAKSLLDEVAKSKVTGEEERYSHIDLTDFAANVDGSKYAYTELRPVLVDERPGAGRDVGQPVRLDRDRARRARLDAGRLGQDRCPVRALHLAHSGRRSRRSRSRWTR